MEDIEQLMSKSRLKNLWFRESITTLTMSPPVQPFKSVCGERLKGLQKEPLIGADSMKYVPLVMALQVSPANQLGTSLKVTWFT